MMRVTRRYRFSACHRLHAPGLTPSENRAAYGQCNNPFGHGHDYLLEVSAQGRPQPATGRVLNPAALDRLVAHAVLEVFHGRNLNAELPEFAAAPPTSENLASAIRRRLQEGWWEAFPDGEPRLARIRLQETRRNSFEIMEEE